MANLALDDVALAGRVRTVPHFHQVDGRQRRGERVAQLVAKHREEFVLRAVRCFRLRTRGIGASDLLIAFTLSGLEESRGLCERIRADAGAP